MIMVSSTTISMIPKKVDSTSNNKNFNKQRAAGAPELQVKQQHRVPPEEDRYKRISSRIILEDDDGTAVMRKKNSAGADGGPRCFASLQHDHISWMMTSSRPPVLSSLAALYPPAGSPFSSKNTKRLRSTAAANDNKNGGDDRLESGDVSVAEQAAAVSSTGTPQAFSAAGVAQARRSTSVVVGEEERLLLQDGITCFTDTAGATDDHDGGGEQDAALLVNDEEELGRFLLSTLVEEDEDKDNEGGAFTTGSTSSMISSTPPDATFVAAPILASNKNNNKRVVFPTNHLGTPHGETCSSSVVKDTNIELLDEGFLFLEDDTPDTGSSIVVPRRGVSTPFSNSPIVMNDFFFPRPLSKICRDQRDHDDEQDDHGRAPRCVSLSSFDLPSSNDPRHKHESTRVGGRAGVSSFSRGGRGPSFRAPADAGQDHEDIAISASSSSACVSSCLPRRFRIYQEDQWMVKYQELKDFVRRTGHTFVPHGVPEKNSLARWAKRQRYQLKLRSEGKESTMTDHRIALLDELGFVWSSHATIWEERLAELKQFQQDMGHCNVPSQYPINQKLATWVKVSRATTT